MTDQEIIYAAVLLIQSIAPEFNVNTNVLTIVTMVESTLVNSGFEDNIRIQMIAYYSAHLLTLSGRGAGASGDVISMSQGELAVTFSKNTSSNNDLSTTSYGLFYSHLLKTFGTTAVTRSGFDWLCPYSRPFIY